MLVYFLVLTTNTFYIQLILQRKQMYILCKEFFVAAHLLPTLFYPNTTKINREQLNSNF